MAHFLRHTSCPSCGSSDAYALYSDGGSHCFSCKYSPKSNKRQLVLNEPENSKEIPITLPSNCSTSYSKDALQWANEYNCTSYDLEHSGTLGYDRQLVFPFYSADGILSAYQCKTFNNPPKGPKYYTRGSLDNLLPIYYNRGSTHSRQYSVFRHLPSLGGSGRQSPVLDRTTTLVLVEDCLSAIKIARQNDAMPCLTSTLSPTKLKRLAGLYGAFLVWLDGDMFHKAQKMAQMLEVLGCTATALYSPLDPKCYDDATISQVLVDKRFPDVV